MPLVHVALTVSDRPRSAAFYGEHFGLTEVVYADAHLLILAAANGSDLALSDAEPMPPELPRTNHFGFRVDRVEEVVAARERFRVAGVTEVEFQHDERFIRVQVLDPDRYRVEVYAHCGT